MSFLRRRFRSRSANGTQSTQAIQMTPPAGASSSQAVTTVGNGQNSSTTQMSIETIQHQIKDQLRDYTDPMSEALTLGDRTQSGVQMTLAIVREVGEMLNHMPYIKGVAGLLLKILEIKDEIGLYRDRWFQVVNHIEVVVNMLKTTMQGLEDSGREPSEELNRVIDGIETGLGEVWEEMQKCRAGSGWTKLKNNILRIERLRTIERQDRKITSIINTSQTSMLFSIRIKQYAALSNSQRLPRPLRRLRTELPPKPSDLTNRDREISAITELIVEDLDRPAKVTILGPEGVGKTSLALHILHHPTLLAVFREERFWVPCQSCTSADGFVTEIAQAIGFKQEQLTRNKEVSVLNYFAGAPNTLLFLDGFEGPWSQEVHEKLAVEGLLARFTGLPKLTVILTMRGLERPASTAWTLPFLRPLKPWLLPEPSPEAVSGVSADAMEDQGPFQSSIFNMTTLPTIRIEDDTTTATSRNSFSSSLPALQAGDITVSGWGVSSLPGIQSTDDRDTPSLPGLRVEEPYSLASLGLDISSLTSKSGAEQPSGLSHSPIFPVS